MITPSGKEQPIKFFFPNRKKIIKIYIKEIVSNHNLRISDRIIKNELNQKYNINISRRSIALYRKEMKISPYFRRFNKGE